MPGGNFDFGRELGHALGQTIAHHNALPPRKKNVHRAAMGAWLLTAVVFTVWWSRALIGWPASTLLTFFLQHPSSAAALVWVPLAGWAIAITVGTLWLVVGVAGSRGPRDTMDIFWAVVQLAIVSGLLLYGAYIPPDYGGTPFINLLLRGFYLCYLAACAVEVVLLLRVGAQGPRSSDAHGRSRTATAEDLKRSGVLR